MFDWWWDFLFNMCQTILSIIDGMFKLFQVFAGIAPQSVVDELSGGNFASGTLLEQLFKSESVQTAFYGIMIISVMFLVISIIIGIARSEVSDKDNKEPKMKLFKKSITAFLLVLVMPVIFTLAIQGAALLIQALASLMAGNTYDHMNTLPQKLFEICLPGGNDPNNPLMWNDSIAQMRFAFSLENYNYFLSMFGGIIILVILAIAVIDLVKRLIVVVFLYLVSPLLLAVMPLDDGARFNVWRDLVVSKLLGVGGMILCLYLYFMLMPIVSAAFAGGGFLAGLAYLVFAIGGAIAATTGGMVVANLVGHNTGMIEGQQQQASTQLVSTGLMSGLKAVGTLAAGAFGLAKKGTASMLGAASAASPAPASAAAGLSADNPGAGNSGTQFSNFMQNMMGGSNMTLASRQQSFMALPSAQGFGEPPATLNPGVGESYLSSRGFGGNGKVIDVPPQDIKPATEEKKTMATDNFKKPEGPSGIEEMLNSDRGLGGKNE